MTLNGNVKEWAMKVIAGVTISSIIAGGSFAFKINADVSVIEARMDLMADDMDEIKDAIKEIPRGEGGLSEVESRRLRNLERGQLEIRCFLSGRRPGDNTPLCRDL